MEKYRPRVVVVSALKSSAVLHPLCAELAEEAGFCAEIVPHILLKKRLQDGRPPEIVIFPYADMTDTTIEQCLAFVPDQSAVLALVSQVTEGRVKRLGRVNQTFRKSAEFDNEQFVKTLLRLVPQVKRP